MREVWRPRDSQRGMLEFARERERRAWWATMGSGKTAAALEHLRRCAEDTFTLDRALVVAPRLVATNVWPQEAAKWAHGAPLGPVRVLTPQDFGFKRLEDVLGRPGGLSIDTREVRNRLLGYTERVHAVSWDLLPWVVKALKKASRYSHLVLDEADFAANHQSQRWKAARFLTKECGAEDVLELTGTPASNGYEQLWSQLYLLDGGARLGRTLTAFREAWMMPDKMNGRTGQVYRWKVAQSRKPELDALIAELALSVRVDLGVAVQEVDHRLPLEGPARALYDELERDYFARLNGGGVVSVANAAVMVSKLMQIAQGAIYDDNKETQRLHGVKLDRLEEIVESSPRGVLLAYPYVHNWEYIKARLPYARHIEESGSISRFSRGETKLLCLHPASGAHGVDGLQLGGQTIVWFGLTHHYGQYAQFNARLVRPGQTETVMLHRIIAEDTIEEVVADVVLPSKCSEQDGLLKAVEWRFQRDSETEEELDVLA